MSVDVHQHLWPEEFVATLLARQGVPRLERSGASEDWLLHTAVEAPYDVTAADHDPALRAASDPEVDLVVLSLSSPLGVEFLPPEEAAALTTAWHEGLARLGGRWRGWASAGLVEPDLRALDATLADDRMVGLQVPATAMATPAAVEALTPVLARAESAGKPVFVHPGATRETLGPDVPAWWPAVVDYVAQMQAAWWSWSHVGRSLLPRLRVCFAAGAGLAPVLHERAALRGAGPLRLDRDVFVETSSLGRQGVDSLVRVLGIDAVCLGSDRPYAVSARHDLGAAAHRALTLVNPCRLLGLAVDHPAFDPPAGDRPGEESR